jgi:hypothetical protein
MAPSLKQHPWSGVLCLEGEWDDSKLKDRSSVLPALELLERLELIQFVHRDIGTCTELEHYLTRWHRERLNYSVLYLAFHGTENGIEIVDAPDGEATLDYLGGLLADRLSNRVVHFGACAVMSAKPRKLERFLEQTGAKAVTGYREDVDWIDSMGWELQFLATLASYKQLGSAFTRLEESAYAGIRKSLGFRVIRP